MNKYIFVLSERHSTENVLFVLRKFKYIIYVNWKWLGYGLNVVAVLVFQSLHILFYESRLKPTAKS